MLLFPSVVNTSGAEKEKMLTHQGQSNSTANKNHYLACVLFQVDVQGKCRLLDDMAVKTISNLLRKSTNCLDRKKRPID